MNPALNKKTLTLIIVLAGLYLNSAAQLNANFNVDRISGCVPVTVNFYNTTTGASDQAKYYWDFGNGTTSTLQNPSALFNAAQTYTVIFTVVDCEKVSTKTLQIGVHNNPIADFSDSLLNSCLPLNVSFTGKATPVDGSIVYYSWNFGDYQSDGGYNYNQITHTYTYAQQPSVSLTVTNSYGCTNTITKSDFNTNYQAVITSFTANQTTLCQVNNQVKFTNNTTGPGTLSYTWDFGDGSTSAAVAPTHVYTTKGNYTVKLTAKTSLGCTNESDKTNYINVANFNVDFTTPAQVCTQNKVSFFDKSDPTYNTIHWTLDGQPFYPIYYYDGSYSWTFNDTLAHIIKLIHSYDNCTVTKTRTIKANLSPVLTGFIANIKNICTTPVTVDFADTTKGAVKWEWFNNTYPDMNNLFATGRTSTYTYSNQYNYSVGLRVTNASGCTDTTWQNVNLIKPSVLILVEGVAGTTPDYGCTTLTYKFSASPSDLIKTYQWSFGDGGNSTSPTPTHSYSSVGSYTVTLNYTTTDGCSGTVNYRYINISGKPNASFKVLPDTVVCGNTPLTFVAAQQVTGWTYYWNFGDGNYFINDPSVITHQYYNDTTYTVSLVVQNGGCADTVIKKQYIRVKPGFPKISGFSNTCNDTRGDVTLTQASRKTNQWIWDFGDGSGTTYQSEVLQLTHTYKKSGTYKVVLTSVNGTCSVRDSVTGYVLLKQSPQINVKQMALCGNDTALVTINNLDINPAPNNYPYSLVFMQYKDSTQAPFPYTSYAFVKNTYTGFIKGLDLTKKGVRAVMVSGYFNCYDTTTNFAPLKLAGPKAAYVFNKNNVCFKDAVMLTDASLADDTNPITTWKWSFGDGSTRTENKAANVVSHQYTTPGAYGVMLTVTDAAGCSNTGYGQSAQIVGPKADFSLSQNPVGVNTRVYFYNNTNTYGAYNTAYTWQLPDGSVSNDSYSSFLFNTVGTDTITLIASNNLQKCADTTYKVVNVLKNAGFSYSISFTNTNGCPPVKVKFTKIFSSLTQVHWDFGDGTQAGDVDSVSHTYYHAGTYRVVLYGYNSNYYYTSVADTLVIKGPSAEMNSDKLAGCDSLNVTFSAVIKNGTSLLWNFGDGAQASSTDTFYTHKYITPGIYKPTLTIKDNAGCSDSTLLPCKIIIDDLSAAIKNRPVVVCDSMLVYFSTDVKSIAKDQLNDPLQYHWDFGTGTGYNTNNPDTASFRYVKSGVYKVNLTVRSPFGCKYIATDSLTVQPVSKAIINGAKEICIASYTSFTGTTNIYTDSLSWNWLFGSNIPAQQQQTTAPISYADSGVYTISLIVNNNGCYDTAYAPLVVHGKPKVNILPQQPIVCIGSKTQVFAHNAVSYIWRPGAYISDTLSASPYISPVTSSWFYVNSKNIFGCTGEDSVWVKVDMPFKIKADSAVNICLGNTGQLHASGADNYQWITGTGLSNTQIANPYVNTNTSQTYTVVGYDKDGCFTDTASVQLKIAPNPTITVTPNSVTINAGTSIQLTTQASADVVNYTWKPADYLSCANCAAPLSSPLLPVTYTATATNSYGCTAADTARINLLCAQELIYIPNAFTPDKDGHNDRFVIKGNGVKLIRHIAIFSRYGDKMFEKSNVARNDDANGWDGTVNATPAAPGAYVFVADIECATGEIYHYKGTIVLIR